MASHEQYHHPTAKWPTIELVGVVWAVITKTKTIIIIIIIIRNKPNNGKYEVCTLFHLAHSEQRITTNCPLPLMLVQLTHTSNPEYRRP